MSRMLLAAMITPVALAALIPGMARSAYGPTKPPPTASTAAPNGEAWAWTQLVNGKNHSTEIRFATTEKPTGNCPTVQYTDQAGKSQSTAMTKASDPFITGGGLQQFPTTLCTLPVPDGASGALIDPKTTNAATVHPGTKQLPLPTWPVSGRPRRLAVIGDAGCDVPSPVSGSQANQDCQKSWPFQTLATHAAARSHPDLVVHVGDYVYREQPQAADDATPGCDTQGQAADWECLVKDVLRPAEALLAQAPIIFARGNHEVCEPQKVGRGAEWYRYFAPDPRKANECFSLPQKEAEPDQINAGSLHFILFDSSLAKDGDQPDKAQAREYAKWFDQANDLAGNHKNHDYFLISHKPLWMVKRASSTDVGWTNQTLAEAVRQTSNHSLAPNIHLTLSGHVHIYQMLDFANSTRAPQLTVGSSGTTLDHAPDDAKVHGKTIDGQTVDNSISFDTFGYALLRDVKDKWRLTFHDSSGQQLSKTCTLQTGKTHHFTC